MEATRGRALSSATTGNPIRLCQIRGARSSAALQSHLKGLVGDLRRTRLCCSGSERRQDLQAKVGPLRIFILV